MSLIESKYIPWNMMAVFQFAQPFAEMDEY